MGFPHSVCLIHNCYNCDANIDKGKRKLLVNDACARPVKSSKVAHESSPGVTETENRLDADSIHVRGVDGVAEQILIVLFLAERLRRRSQCLSDLDRDCIQLRVPCEAYFE